MILDCHVHASKGSIAPSLAHHRVRSRRAGIAGSVLFAAAYQRDYGPANRAVARACVRSEGRYIGFVYVHCATDRGRIDAILGAAVGQGFRGVKVHAADAPISEELCAAAGRHGLPVLCDIVGETRYLEMMGQDYPTVQFIIAHLGSFQDDPRAQRAVIAELGRCENLHADTSAVRHFDLLAAAVRVAGPRKLLFGSDAPWLHPGLELEKVRALRLTPREEQAVLGGNLCRLLGLTTAPMSSGG